jgi:MFS family permease
VRDRPGPVVARSAERRAIGVVFIVNGISVGTFASRLPWIAARLHLSSGLIGVVGLMTSIGAIAAIPVAAQFVHRAGPKAATRALITGSCLSAGLPVFAPDLPVLVLVMLLIGALLGTVDNAMNAQAVEAEDRIGKSIMSGLHGLWSVGVLVGALTSAAAAHAHIDPRVQFATTAVVAAAGGAIATYWFIGNSPEAVTSGGSSSSSPRDAAGGFSGSSPRDAAGGSGGSSPRDVAAVPKFAWPRGALLLIGLVGFAAIFVEFAANDWAALFMHWDLHTSQAAAALGTSVFAGSMAAGRLSGDVVVRRTGPVLIVRACGILGTVGCVLVAVAPDVAAAMTGFVLIGLGVSVVVPLVFAAAGRSGPSPAIGVAGVATVSYGAGLAAPSVMGGVADISSLRIAFAVSALLAVAVAAGAGLLGQRADRAESRSDAGSLDLEEDQLRR